MANWAQGLASGLETGYRMGELYQRGAERRRLQEAAQATPQELQGYTAEQGAQLEAAAKSGLYDIGMKQDEAGNFQGYTVTPKAAPDMQGLVAPGQVSEMYGQRYEGQLTPERVTGLRMGRMADIVSETDPIKAQQLRAQQAEQEYQAQARPIALKTAGLNLEEAERKGAAATRKQQFESWYSENPKASFNDIMTQAKTMGMGLGEIKDAAANITGISKAQFDETELQLKNLVKGKNLDQLLEAHKTSDLLDPGSHFERVMGKNGQMTINRVDSATGKVIQANVFSGNENEVLGYLNKAAVSPEAIVDYTMNLQKAKVAMGKDQATAEYYQSRKGLDKMGAAQYFTGADGNTYAAVPKMGPQGLSFETVRVNPEGIKLSRPGAEGAGMKPEKAPEAGTRFTIGGKPAMADGYGGFIDVKGVLPDERTDFLKKSGVPENLIGQLPWNAAGTQVGFGGKAYDIRNPADVKQLSKDYEKSGKAGITLDEESKRSYNIQQRIRALGGEQPSPYDDPEVWAHYRRQQRQ